jgi:hypothetical protein
MAVEVKRELTQSQGNKHQLQSSQWLLREKPELTQSQGHKHQLQDL